MQMLHFWAPLSLGPRLKLPALPPSLRPCILVIFVTLKIYTVYFFRSCRAALANPRPLKLFSAALQLSLEIVLLEKNQQNHWNFRKIWPFLSLFFENAALDLIWVGRRCCRAISNSEYKMLPLDQLWATQIKSRVAFKICFKKYLYRCVFSIMS